MMSTTDQQQQQSTLSSTAKEPERTSEAVGIENAVEDEVEDEEMTIEDTSQQMEMDVEIEKEPIVRVDDAHQSVLDEEETENICRYCLGPNESDSPEDPLISPCVCKGGQKWCHLACLKRWQRSVLVTQPTHPAFYERDERQFICNVCKTPFAIAPPSRREMMQSFTGSELAALLEVGCLIVCDTKTSKYMAETVRHNSHIPSINDMKHWIGGVYLITSIEEDMASDGEDCIVAVNVTRRYNELPAILKEIVGKLYKASALHVGCSVITTDLQTKKYNDTAGVILKRLETGRLQVRIGKKKSIAIKPCNCILTDEALPEAQLSHYIGGPCHATMCTSLAVLTATHPDELVKANVKLGGNQGGLWVTGDVDDVSAIARTDAARTGGTAKVDTFWGDARWSRTQLLGEIARGSWGVCRAEVPDVNSSMVESSEPMEHITWDSILNSDRLIFAEKSEMTDADIHADSPTTTQEEEDELARERHANMLETQQRLKAQLLARLKAEKEIVANEPRPRPTSESELDEPLID